MDKTLETAQLLARFKLLVKRSLSESVDLERLTREPIYARRRLAEIENAAEDENLLIMVLRVRDAVLPAPIAPLQPTAQAEPEAERKTRETRSYVMGARAW